MGECGADGEAVEDFRTSVDSAATRHGGRSSLWARHVIRHWWQTGLVTVVAVGAVLRLVSLGTVPLPFADEVEGAVDVLSVVRNNVHIGGAPVGFMGRVIPLLNGRLLIAALGGTSIEAFRVVPAAFGVASIVVVALLGARLYHRTVGLAAGALLATMPWAIYYSRVDLPVSEYVFLSSLFVLLGIRFLDSPSATKAIACSCSAAVGFYIYPAGVVGFPLYALVGAIVYWHRVRAVPLRYWLVGSAAIVSGGVVYWLELLQGHSSNSETTSHIVQSRLLWGHGLSLGAETHLFLVHWLSYWTPSFLALSGDPNVRQSIQTVGEVGLVATLLGLIGIIGSIVHFKDYGSRLLLGMLIVYPIPDALTYQNAFASSVVGSLGMVWWAMAGGVGVGVVVQLARDTRVARLAAAIVLVGLIAQTVYMMGYYLGPYSRRYSWAFVAPATFAPIARALTRNHLEAVPITYHAGYLRSPILEYMTGYRVHVTSWYPSCYPLPRAVLAYTVSPRVFIVREGTDYQGVPGCLNQADVITRDREDLLAFGWHLRTLVQFRNGADSRYMSVVWLAVRSGMGG